jgi:tetratricopeptide (TPR) repeat protein
MTQTNLGILLRRLGERTEGVQSLKYLKEAEVAHRAALEVNTRQEWPEKWAITQINLGNVLDNLSERTEGVQSLKYLKEAETAYRAALEVKTRQEWPEDWAETQTNLGALLQRMGERTEGAQSLKYLQEAEAAYRAALEIKTRRMKPHDWALMQNNLGNVLRKLGERTEGAQSLMYLQEAEAAHHAALEVRTRQEFPQDWADTQNNLGILLRRLGEQMEGEQSVKYLKEAETAHRAALEVFTLVRWPREWAKTQKNLAFAYLALKDWANAGEAFINVLRVFPDDKETYNEAAMLYHELLFNFDQAFALHQQWLARHESDVDAQPDFAEAHFTTGRFSECRQRIAALLVQPKISDSTKTALRAIEIASLLAINGADQVPGKLDTLIAEISRQRDEFKVGWKFDGTKHFINQNEKLSPHRAWLVQLLDALAGEDRDKIRKAMQKVRAEFRE